MNPYVLGALAGGVLFGGHTLSRFEREAAYEIKNDLGGAEVRVHANLGFQSIWGTVPSITIRASRFTTDGLPFHTEPWRSRKGKLDRLNLDMRDFSLSGLRVDSLEAVVPRCRFDMALALAHHRFRLSRSGTGPITVTIRDADFEPFILRKFPEVRSVQVRISGGRATVEGFAQLGLLGARFKVEAALAPRDGSQLVFQDAHIELAGKPADPRLASTLLGFFDPVIDLNKDMHLENAIHIDSVQLRDGFLVGKGLVTIPDAKQATARKPIDPLRG